MTVMSGRFLRGLKLWMAAAISSFPVPVSPRTRTVVSARRNLLGSIEDILDAIALADDMGGVLFPVDFLAEKYIFDHQAVFQCLDFLQGLDEVLLYLLMFLYLLLQFSAFLDVGDRGQAERIFVGGRNRRNAVKLGVERFAVFLEKSKGTGLFAFCRKYFF